MADWHIHTYIHRLPVGVGRRLASRYLGQVLQGKRNLMANRYDRARPMALSIGYGVHGAL